MSIDSQDSLKYWLALKQIYALGPIAWKKLLTHFTDPAEIWHASQHKLSETRLPKKIVDLVISERSRISPERCLERLNKNTLSVVTITDKAYPTLLKTIYDPPPVLFYRGDVRLLSATVVGIVGSRRPNSYGKHVTDLITADASRNGLVTVSGLAFGIDTIVAKSTLAAGGKTIAVLGSGLDQIYPVANRPLAEKIIAGGGLVISEFIPGTPALKHHFPLRNRIIAGLSAAVIITQAGKTSGALITARYATEHGRDVFAVPGLITDPLSAGVNQLIADGATPYQMAADLLNALHLTPEIVAQKQNIALTPTEEKIVLVLTHQPTHVDKIVQAVRLEIPVVNATLAALELKRVIKNIGNQTFIKLP